MQGQTGSAAKVQASHQEAESSGLDGKGGQAEGEVGCIPEEEAQGDGTLSGV